MYSNITSYFLDRNEGSRTALITPERTVTYAELIALSNRAGNALHQLGVRSGQRVLLALNDGVDFVAVWYGAQKIGAVTAEVYTFLQPKDYEYFLNYTEALAVIADATTLGPLREAGARNLVVAGVDESELRPGEHSLSALLAEAADQLDPVEGPDDEVAIWKFTTGSTGAPKACTHTRRSPIRSFELYAKEILGINADDKVLGVPKLFFGYARDLVAMFPFGVGGSGIAFPERTTPELLFHLIAEHRPTILVNVPTMMSAMLAHPAAAEQDLSCLRLCTSAGEALPAEVHRKWDETFGVEVVDGIGSSEAYHIFLSNRPGAAKRGSLGREVPGYSARVIDESGAVLPDGEIGTLEVTGPTIAGEYWGDAEKSARTFDGETLRSGDLFSRDAEGFFTHHGRADDLLKIGGIFVAPSEIENCLLGHADVVECAALGYEQDGLARVRAFVVRSGTVTEDELREYARARLAGHKYPREIVFVDTLPRTANGKLDRRALRTEDR
ncbi:benzoate-CoA ligase family protein [Amycolatopsis sp. 195334CR]|uniref:benzoate-CoA ligase family protein n=1 Tax=Amycolatopsis sp. 195334CR TaxID=2814588 RepID=UPI001A90BDFF|nr:benzoate-CoA ligase family protein [Amycolatopsis sp. 195334CR]MBN6037141.1 benzoate-CoA ligase family protein [Amycolatopsis sp. 195334CR]